MMPAPPAVIMDSNFMVSCMDALCLACLHPARLATEFRPEYVSMLRRPRMRQLAGRTPPYCSATQGPLIISTWLAKRQAVHHHRSCMSAIAQPHCCPAAYATFHAFILHRTPPVHSHRVPFPPPAQTPYGTLMNFAKLRLYVSAGLPYGKPVYFEAAVERYKDMGVLEGGFMNAMLAGSNNLGITNCECRHKTNRNDVT